MGLSLDQIQNDITRKTPASFEPSIDYVVTKIPRFAFEKFPGAKAELTTQMKSVGEAMAMGRTFQESFQKALRSLETGLDGWSLPKSWKPMTKQVLEYNLRVPNPERVLVLKQAMLDGYSDADLHRLTAIDPWFLAQMRDLHDTEEWLRKQAPAGLASIKASDWLQVKKRGFSDPQIAAAFGLAAPAGAGALEVRRARTALGVVPAFRRVDTCAAEFAADTPYMYSCYDGNCEAAPTTNKKGTGGGGYFFCFFSRGVPRRRKKKEKTFLSLEFSIVPLCALTLPSFFFSFLPSKNNAHPVLILGGGPNRIGQGIEFDYCCCHASFSLREKGFETIMMNSNPETVSTDYDTSSRLYFEPLTGESLSETGEVGRERERERERERGGERKRKKKSEEEKGENHCQLFPPRPLCFHHHAPKYVNKNSRGRPQRRRKVPPRRHHRPVRRADPPEARDAARRVPQGEPDPGCLGRRQRQDLGHAAREHRRGRGSRPLVRAAAEAADQAAPRDDGLVGGGGAEGRRRAGISGHGQALVRAGGPGDGDRLLGQGPVAVHQERRRGRPGQARASRQGAENGGLFSPFFSPCFFWCRRGNHWSKERTLTSLSPLFLSPSPSP